MRWYWAMSALLIAWVILMQILHLNIGRADNGDYARVMTWFTSGPVGFESEWPVAGTQEHERRFFRYVLPYWKLDFPLTSQVLSSVLLLWAPGIAVNYFLYSSTVLSLSAVSLVPRMMVVAFMTLLLVWIGRTTPMASQRLLLLGTLALPTALLLSTTDYVSYFSSFYQETGSLIYLLALLGALVALWQRWTWRRALLALTSLCLLTAAKTSNAYWPVLVVPLLASPAALYRRPVALLLSGILLTAGIAGTGVWLSGSQSILQVNIFHGLMYGVLTMSSDTDQRLAELGLGDLRDCVDHGSWENSTVYARCVDENGHRYSRLQQMLVLTREPQIIPRIASYAIGKMQSTSIPYLGTFAQDDPAAGTTQPALNFWSHVKQRLLPRGHGLLLLLAGYAVVCLIALRVSGSNAHLARVGILLTMAVLADMYVAFLGDGKQELAKHLFLANILFDLSTIIAIALVVLGISRVLFAPLSTLSDRDLPRLHGFEP